MLYKFSFATNKLYRKSFRNVICSPFNSKATYFTNNLFGIMLFDGSDKGYNCDIFVNIQHLSRDSYVIWKSNDQQWFPF